MMKNCCKVHLNLVKSNAGYLCKVCGNISSEETYNKLVATTLELSGELTSFSKTPSHQKEIKDKRNNINGRIKVD